MRRSPSLTTVAFLPLLVACGGSASRFTDASSQDSAFTSPTNDSDSGAATTTETSPAWWSFDGVVTVSYGDPDPSLSSLVVSLWDGETTLVCQLDVAVSAMENATDGPDDALAFWRADLDDGVPTTEPCDAWPSRALWIGLAPYDPALDAAAFEHDWSGATAYSLLVREFDGGQVWTVGLAGTAEQWDGTSLPVETAPVEDGVYELHALYVLPIP
ncbi:MAG: hypothetical protein KC621_30465 [Myxococcales bacterium]|nr:hypothetical protein [Myxococcales bacterium]